MDSIVAFFEAVTYITLGVISIVFWFAVIVAGLVEIFDNFKESRNKDSDSYREVEF